MKHPQHPRERAARALARYNDVPENTKFEGRPMWESFLPEVDAVLEAALGVDALEKLKQDEAKSD
ncbi:hypothetical protein [Agrobacterium tumefaciens]|uniref:hypothetical protein n=1 Tax=Agrobacterium tumefaciens TaxID=358 RepID=UPI001CBFA54C|nr:hypothetical protein [Agrobacterium tumefaciens]